MRVPPKDTTAYPIRVAQPVLTLLCRHLPRTIIILWTVVEPVVYVAHIKGVTLKRTLVSEPNSLYESQKTMRF